MQVRNTWGHEVERILRRSKIGDQYFMMMKGRDMDIF